MVNGAEVPLQLFAVGVTWQLNVQGEVPPLFIVLTGIWPLPCGDGFGQPVIVPGTEPGLLNVHEKLPPATELLKLVNAVETPPQIVWFVDKVNTGFGFTVMVQVTAGPEQPFLVGITL